MRGDLHAVEPLADYPQVLAVGGHHAFGRARGAGGKHDVHAVIWRYLCCAFQHLLTWYFFGALQKFRPIGIAGLCVADYDDLGHVIRAMLAQQGWIMLAQKIAGAQ